VYPPGAKSTVEITATDLDRLRDNEFLNDSCIDFYLK
jgi:Ulp1 family protease